MVYGENIFDLNNTVYFSFRKIYIKTQYLYIPPHQTHVIGEDYNRLKTLLLGLENAKPVIQLSANQMNTCCLFY